MGLIRDIITIRREAAETKKALRILNEQNWSIEFLQAMLVKASKVYGRGLEMTINSPDGKSITMKSLDVIDKPTNLPDDDIFQHLDDERRIQEFITELNRKRNK